MDKVFYVDILSSKKNGILYIGVISNLLKRVYEHKSEMVEGFTKKYNVNKLVYFEQYNTANTAISREKKLQNWRRRWKLDLIKKSNADWKDLYKELTGS
jgi:putative endonuclease